MKRPSSKKADKAAANPGKADDDDRRMSDLEVLIRVYLDSMSFDLTVY